jgi:hypothetical protein
MALAGSFAVWPTRTARLRSAPVVLQVGTPIETVGLGLEDRGRLRDEVAKRWRPCASRLARLAQLSASEPG